MSDVQPERNVVLDSAIEIIRELKKVFDEVQTPLEIIRIDEILYLGTQLKVSFMLRGPSQSDDEQKEHS